MLTPCLPIKDPPTTSCVHAGVPVSDVSLEIWPPGGQVMKGDKLIFICSVAEGTGNITFSWYKGAPSLRLETKIQFSQRAEFEVLSARESDTDRYYCAADNGSGSGPSLSGLVSVKVRGKSYLLLLSCQTLNWAACVPGAT